MRKSILIVDDDRDVLDALQVLLEDEFQEIVLESNVVRLPVLLREQYDVILLDMNFSAGINTGNEGLFWLSKALTSNPRACVLVMTAYGNIALAVEAIKRGAKDFILKPFDNEKLLSTIRASMKTTRKADLPATEETPWVIGTSAAMHKLYDQVSRVAPTDAAVLILGENGTGKDVIANELHRRSQRSNKRMVKIDLATIVSSLFESELFGHTKGAFTDAKTERVGRFVEADGSTLFLDEIGNIGLHEQAKILTVLQSQVVTPVGSDHSVRIDTRLISATNMDLTRRIHEGFFRQDLLYRLNTVTLTIPPLRERPEDIIPLSQHFLEYFGNRYQRESSFDPSALKALQRYAWPGNVRELRHVIEKAVILAEGAVILERDLNLAIPLQRKAGVTGKLEEMERMALIDALHENRGNVVHAAKALGITRQTFYNKMKKYGIE